MKEITKETMEQYEVIRRSGACNMFDYNCVKSTANIIQMHSLASLDRDDYFELLTNFGKLMKKFDIQQP